MKVDVGALDNVLKKIDAFRNEYSETIKSENRVVTDFLENWNGDDSYKFYAKWEELTKDNKSDEKLFREEVDEMYNLINYMKSSYEQKQSDVIQKANSLNIY